MGRLAVESWITSDFASRLFAWLARTWTTHSGAARRDFKPIPLGIHERLKIHNSLQTIDSHNVIAKITGSDPELKNTYVIYTSALGSLRNRAGGQRRQNLTTAPWTTPPDRQRCWRWRAPTNSSAHRRPERSCSFPSLEKSKVCSARNIMRSIRSNPLARTAVDINMDGMNVHGLTRDIRADRPRRIVHWTK